MMNTPFCDRCHKANVQVRTSQRGREYKANVQIYPSGAYFRGLHTSEECDEQLAAWNARLEAKRQYEIDAELHSEAGLAMHERFRAHIAAGGEWTLEMDAELAEHWNQAPVRADYEF